MEYDESGVFYSTNRPRPGKSRRDTVVITEIDATNKKPFSGHLYLVDMIQPPALQKVLSEVVFEKYLRFTTLPPARGYGHVSA